MANKTEVGKIVNMLIDAYPSKQFTNLAGFVQTATAVLGEFHMAQLETAALECIKTSKFFPSLAELREAAVDAGRIATTEAEHRRQLETYRYNWRAPVEFLDAMRRFEFLAPEDWTSDDRASFRNLMGRDVDFENDDLDAPWMAWKVEAVAA